MLTQKQLAFRLIAIHEAINAAVFRAGADKPVTLSLEEWRRIYRLSNISNADTRTVANHEQTRHDTELREPKKDS